MSSQLKGAHERIQQLEEELERTRSVRAAARDMLRRSTSSTVDDWPTPPLDLSGFQEDVVYGENVLDEEEMQAMIRDQGTATSRHAPVGGKAAVPATAARAVAPPRIPQQSEDGWWS